MNAEKRKIVVAVSGGFDPLHIGHIDMINEAKALGNELVVILNNDNWLRKKKDTFSCHKTKEKKSWKRYGR